MYNLFVSGDDEAWNGDHVVFDVSRCVKEYTDIDLIEVYGSLDDSAKQRLMKLPCLFVYENGININPRFGYIKEIVKRGRRVRIKFEIIEEADGVLSYEDLKELSFELDIAEHWELNRTHWAIKKADIEKELAGRGFHIRPISRKKDSPIDISKHLFAVALSFPGEVRSLAKTVADDLNNFLGDGACFYDENYKAQLARPSLDILLQDIYLNRAGLNVVFISGDYQKKEWCGIEFRAIRNMIMNKKLDRVMFIRVGEGEVDGVFKTDGYIDAALHSPGELAQFIVERVEIIKSQS